MSGILISASDYEPAVAYFFPYALKARDLARSKGYEVLPCLGPDQNQGNIFKNAVKAQLILHNGHGNSNVTTGHGSEVIWQACNYPTSTVEKKIIFLLSCLCGQALATDMVAKKARAVIAWDEVYIFNAAGSPDPLTDPYVQLFFGPILDGFTGMLDGKTVGDWADTIIQAYAKALNSPGVPEHVKANLAWDANHMKLFGDRNATIQPTPPTPPAPQPPEEEYEGELVFVDDIPVVTGIGRWTIRMTVYTGGRKAKIRLRKVNKSA